MMTKLFNRHVQVIIDAGAGQERIELSPEISVSFDIRKDRSKNPNQVDLTIRNINKRSRTALSKTGAQASIIAGYGEVKALLAIGNVVRSATSWEPPDSLTKMHIADGIQVLQNRNLSLSFKRGASTGSVLEAIAARVGLPLRIGDGVDDTAQFQTGYSHVGKLGHALTEVSRRAGARWSIQNGVLQVVSPSDKQTSVYELSPESGLIARPEEVESTVVSDKVVAGRLPKRGYIVTALLLPTINPNDLIKIKSRDVNGTFVVDEVQHQGGNREEAMQTRLTVYE